MIETFELGLNDPTGLIVTDDTRVDSQTTVLIVDNDVGEYTHTHTHIHTHARARTHAHTHAHTHTHTHTHTSAITAPSMQ